MGFRKNRHDEFVLPPHLRIIAQMAEEAAALRQQEEEAVMIAEVIEPSVPEPVVETVKLSEPEVVIHQETKETETTPVEIQNKPVLKNALKKMPTESDKKKKVASEKKASTKKQSAAVEQPKKD